MPTTPASGEVTMYPFLRYQDAPAAITWLVQASGLGARDLVGNLWSFGTCRPGTGAA